MKLTGGPEDPIWHVRGKDPSRCVVAFAGFYRGVNGHPVEFRRWSRTTDWSWIFVRDLRSSWYTRGVSDCTPSPAALLGRLAHLLLDLAPAHVVATGTCMGGWAALWFGTLLGVDHVVGLSPVTKLEDGRFQPTMDAALAHDDAVEPPDLGRLIVECPTPPRYDLHACDAEVGDSRHLARLAGLPHVRTHYHPCDQHNVAWYLRDAGLLGEALR